MLLNEFLKEHKSFVEEQHKVEKLEATVAELAEQVQKLTAQAETKKSRAQVAVIDR
jgi:cell division protein FtsB